MDFEESLSAAATGIPILAIANSSQLVQNNTFHGFLCLILECWGYHVVAEDVVSLEKILFETVLLSLLCAKINMPIWIGKKNL